MTKRYVVVLQGYGFQHFYPTKLVAKVAQRYWGLLGFESVVKKCSK